MNHESDSRRSRLTTTPRAAAIAGILFSLPLIANPALAAKRAQEHEVLELPAQRLSAKENARRLMISDATVSCYTFFTHFRRLLRPGGHDSLMMRLTSP
jgi:DNA-binding NarL/FixJ family response regulator